MNDKPLQPRQLVLTCAGRAAMVIRVDEEAHEVVLRALDSGDLIAHRLAHVRPLGDGLVLFVAAQAPEEESA